MFMQVIAEILDEMGLPKGVFNLVNGDRPVVEHMLNSAHIQAMAFVGSTKVGQIVAEGCAKNQQKKPWCWPAQKYHDCCQRCQSGRLCRQL